MIKSLSVRQFAAIKRVAQNVNPLVTKKTKILNKIQELNNEYKDLSTEIDGHEMGIKAITGGFSSEYLIVKKVEDTGKVDKNGNPIKTTKYEPNEKVIHYNAETNTYDIELVEENEDTEEPVESNENIIAE